MRRATRFVVLRSHVLPRLLIALLPVILLPGCSVGICLRSLFGERMDIRVTADETANDEYPLAMEVVFVRDDELFTKLLQMTAKEWFEQRTSLLNGGGKEKLESWHWEWTPGHDTTVSLPLYGSVSGTVVFVNYFSSGQHRIRIEPRQDILVRLNFDDFTVEPM